MPPPTPPLQIAVYISGHGYGHYTRTLKFLSLFPDPQKYNFHIRTTSPLYASPLKYALHPSVIQTNAYQLDGEASLRSLLEFDSSIAEASESTFLKEHSITAILSDAVSLPCLLGHRLNIPSILVTNFTFDSIFQALLDATPNPIQKAETQHKITEMIRQYALSHTVIRLPGSIPFPFHGPRIVDAPMHFRAALRSRTETLSFLNLPSLADKKILLHCFGGHGLEKPSQIPTLPEGWACLSQTIHHPPLFYKYPQDAYMPDLIGACDAVLGKLGWGTCSEVIGTGYKAFIYVPRSAFIEEAGLLEWMESAHRKLVRLEVTDYESERWKDSIWKAEEVLGVEVEGEDWVGNERELVRILEDTLEAALG